MHPAPRKRGRPRLPAPSLVEGIVAARAVGLRLTRLRRAQGWSQVGLARAIRTCPKTLRRWERCESPITTDYLMRLQAAFNCDWTTLLGEPTGKVG